MKATAIARPNLALVKYWGKLNQELNLPLNNNIGITQEGLETKTTVEFLPELKEDEIEIDRKVLDKEKAKKMVKHLDRIRKLANFSTRAKVISENSFPGSAGLASSASGFAALSYAGVKAAGLELTKKELSILARKGSGSACRSIFGGFVEWVSGRTDGGSYSEQIAPPEQMDIKLLVCLVPGEKKVSSTEGHKIADTSPLLKCRLSSTKENLTKIRTGILEKDFSTLGKYSERDTITMHAVMMSSSPPLFYWSPKTLEIIKKVIELRESGTECYFSIDAGPKVHILCEEKNLNEINREIKKSGINTIISSPGEGVELTNKHLF